MQKTILADREKPPDRVRHSAPFSEVHFRDAGKRDVVVGERSAPPIGHQEEKICTVLDRGEVHRVAEIIADVERHPRPGRGHRTASRHPARRKSGETFPPREELHGLQRGWMFSIASEPPSLGGIMWSFVSHPAGLLHCTHRPQQNDISASHSAAVWVPRARAFFNASFRRLLILPALYLSRSRLNSHPCGTSLLNLFLFLLIAQWKSGNSQTGTTLLSQTI